MPASVPSADAVACFVLVSILIPCHDEEEALPHLFEALDELPAILGAEREVEVVFVDDGSTDRTAALVEDYAGRAGWPVRLVRRTPRGGIGLALRDGLGSVRGKVVITYDADRAYPLADIARLLAAIEAGADVATASPWHPEGASEGLPAHRSGLSRIASWLYRLRLGRRAQALHTFTCGFRAWRREAILAVPPRRAGFVATAEMLVRALRAGARAAEVPSTLRVRTEGRSKMRAWRTARAHLGLLLRGG